MQYGAVQQQPAGYGQMQPQQQQYQQYAQQPQAAVAQPQQVGFFLSFLHIHVHSSCIFL